MGEGKINEIMVTGVVYGGDDRDEPDRPALVLDIPKDQNFDEWVHMGRRLCSSSQVINWYIGDWWAAGQHRYGARAKAAAEGIFGKEFTTLVHYAAVCRSFESGRRRPHLSYTHHAEVAALPPDEADALLEKAATEQLSTRELRKEVLRHRLASGDFSFQREEDVEHDQTVAIARDWNRAVYPARRTILDLLEEAGAIKILTDTAEQVELDP